MQVIRFASILSSRISSRRDTSRSVVSDQRKSPVGDNRRAHAGYTHLWPELPSLVQLADATFTSHWEHIVGPSRQHHLSYCRRATSLDTRTCDRSQHGPRTMSLWPWRCIGVREGTRQTLNSPSTLEQDGNYSPGHLAATSAFSPLRVFPPATHTWT